MLFQLSQVSVSNAEAEILRRGNLPSVSTLWYHDIIRYMYLVSAKYILVQVPEIVSKTLIGSDARRISHSNIWPLKCQFLIQSSWELYNIFSDRSVWHRAPKLLSWVTEAIFFVLMKWLLADCWIVSGWELIATGSNYVIQRLEFSSSTHPTSGDRKGVKVELTRK